MRKGVAAEVWIYRPLSAEDVIPRHGKKLFVGTGMYGKLSLMSELHAAAEKKGIEVVARPTPEICGMLQDLKPEDVNAILHATCRSNLVRRTASPAPSETYDYGIGDPVAEHRKKKDHAGSPCVVFEPEVSLT